MKRIFDKGNDGKMNIKWFKQIKEDLRVKNINMTYLKGRRVFRKRILKLKGIQKDMKECANLNWSKERRKQHSERMKE